MEREIDMKEVSDGRLYTSNDLVKADCGGCEGCSSCCTGMGSSITLDPLDVFRLCAATGKDFESMLDRQIELNIVDGVILPNLKMAGDGEGATALFEVKIVGAESKEQAVTLSKSVVTSSLVKAAIYGHDANWGRILCAMGYSGAQFDPEKVDLFFESAAGRIQIIENGVAVDYSEEEATRILSEPEVTAIADVKMGTASAVAWGCDLTYDYVKINADYRS